MKCRDGLATTTGTAQGHGYFRKFNRERPKKDFRAKRRQREKMTKASRRKNRGR